MPAMGEARARRLGLHAPHAHTPPPNDPEASRGSTERRLLSEGRFLSVLGR